MKKEYKKPDCIVIRGFQGESLMAGSGRNHRHHYYHDHYDDPCDCDYGKDHSKGDRDYEDWLYGG